MPINFKKSRLYKKIFETLLGTIISIILSFGAMSESIYLLYSYKNEIKQAENSRSEFQSLNERHDSFIRLTEIYYSTEFTGSQLGIEANFIEEIKINKDKSKLEAFDTPIMNIAHIWHYETNQKLSATKISVQGFVYQQDNVFDLQPIQSQMVANIDRELSLLDKITYMVINTDTLTIAERNTKITEIDKFFYQQQENYISIGVAISEMDKRFNLKLNRLNNIKEKTEGTLSLLWAKCALSIAGIIAGFLMFALSLFMFIRYHLEKKMRSQEKRG